MTEGFWARRRPGWVLGGVGVGAVTLALALLRLPEGADIADILALPVAAVGLLVAVWALMPRVPIEDLARRLAVQVRDERGRFRQQALADVGAPRPAEVTFRAPRAESEPELLVRWRDDGGQRVGKLSDIADYYRKLKLGRLVIIGEPGSGKTVLATQLVIDLIDAILARGQWVAYGARVPVWLSLPSCDLGAPAVLAEADPIALLGRIEAWIREQLTKVYGVKAADARTLLDNGWVLPVLDGLDEMDPTNSDEVVPTRAAAVVRALNARPAPVVLVGRSSTYLALAGGEAGPADGTHLLQDAQQIMLQPLSPQAICDYLAYRFRGPGGDLEPRWHPVREALRADEGRPPEAIAERRSLAAVLGSPWRLFLAVTAYFDPATKPAELTHYPADTLSSRLIAQLIPAVTARVPTYAGRRYNPVEVARWLRTLAGHLRSTNAQHGWSLTDFSILDLWPIGGWKAARYLSLAIAATMVVGVTTLAGLNGYLVDPLGFQLWVVLFSCAVGLAMLAAPFLGVWRVQVWRVEMSRAYKATGRRKLAFGLLSGLAVGLMLGLAGGLVGWFISSSLIVVFMIGFAFGFASGFVLGFTAGREFGRAGEVTIEKPSAILKQETALTLLVSVIGPLVFAYGLVAVVARPADGLNWLAAMVALAMAMLIAIFAQNLRFWVSVFIAARSGRLPVRMVSFLDWAYSAGLLRLSGITIQFRHRELQDWLESEPEPAVQPNFVSST